MGKFYNNKFFISFLILTVIIFSLSVKTVRAEGVLNVVIVIISVAVAILVPIVVPYIFGNTAIITSLAGGIAGVVGITGIVASAVLNTTFYIALGQALCLSGSDNTYWSGCGGGGGGFIITAPFLMSTGASCQGGQMALALPSFFEKDAEKLLGYNYWLNKIDSKTSALFSYRVNSTTVKSISATSTTIAELQQKYGKVIVAFTTSTVSSSWGDKSTVITSPTTTIALIATSTINYLDKLPEEATTIPSDTSYGPPTGPPDSTTKPLVITTVTYYFVPKGTATRYPIISRNFIVASQYGVIGSLDESEFDVELYRFTASTTHLVSWLYPWSSSKAGFSLTAGPGLYDFGGQQLWPGNICANSTRPERCGGDKEPTSSSTLTNAAYASTDNMNQQMVLKGKYKDFCMNGICNLLDPYPPQGLYLAYMAKVKGDFGNVEKKDSWWQWQYSEESGYYWNSNFMLPYGTTNEQALTPSNIPDSFFAIKARYLNIISTSTKSTFSWYACDEGGCTQPQGNIIYGPLAPLNFFSGACPATQVSLNSTPVAELPAPVNVWWSSSNADSCLASNAWSGNKPASGQESLNKPRGSYTFELSCSGPNGTASSTSVSRVIQVPRCSFSGNPSSIVPPQTSVLEWSCQYADSCSIDQSVGVVSNVSGSKTVSPQTTTTYTLSCQGLDGNKSYQTIVNVGSGGGRLREIIPR
ncbi:MAG: hypothetical protein UT92_C0001G0022 [Candidatus Curtissbacteria bacterium GW2011_GWA1_40_24]|uniref:Uncharacterized protein n=2 Tax=Patescibacteria group TaxID=1783273 RepID=A0A0G0RSP0_9BACT|nr:MAG: hypothetical protein UT92_C0001G0022 [Candidatus Curtissbacteria bacterium GW2011_GWA1_40_24]KKR89019.1 MAG: hypothetical protein UU38_C0002G0022 [Candidatus Wolfebacteria bacterium GW2011_GWB1_41_12]